MVNDCGAASPDDYCTDGPPVRWLERLRLPVWLCPRHHQIWTETK